MDPTFLIRIIVRARNEIDSVMQRAAASVDRVTASEKRHEQQAKKTQQSAASLRKEFDDFTASVRRGEKSVDDSVFGLRRLASEMDRLAKQRPIGDVTGEALNRAAVAARRHIAEIQDVQRAQTKAVQQEISDRGKAVESRLRDQQSQRALRTEVERVTNEYDRFHIAVQRGEITGSRAAQGYRDFGNELGRLRKSFAAGSDDSLNLGQKMEEARAHANNLTKDLRRTRSASDEVHAALGRLFNIDPSKLERIDNRIEDFNKSLNRGRFNVAAFDNRLRGLIYVGVFAFFQQLVGVTVSLAGALVELAGAAVQAGLALAGMAAAGAAQAIPLFGLLAAAWGRVGAVFKAAQQAQKAATQSSYNHTEALNKQKAATEAVTNAQRALDKARFDARRNLEDLIDAERRAQLQAEAATLAQSDAQKALRTAVATGDFSSLARARLDVRQADLGVNEANMARSRAVFDANQARRQGVEGNPSVVAARQALADARQSAADTQKQMAATDRTLQQLVAQLSPTEHKLYESIRRIQADYKKVFRPITDIIVGAFSGAINRVDKVMKDPRVVGTARVMADAVGGQITRVTKFLTNNININFFERMGEEASRNLPKVVTIFENLYKIFRNFADAATPALRTFLNFIENLTRAAADATSSGSGMAKLSSFFAQGEKSAEGITKLAIAVGKLIFALTGASAGEGLSLLDSMTAKINEATTWIQGHQGEVHQFFQDALRATGLIAHAIWEITKALFGLFHADQVKSFTDALVHTLLPTLERVFQVMGTVTHVFLEFAGSGPGSALMQFLLVTTLLRKSFSPIITLISSIVVGFGKLFPSLRLVSGGLTAVEIASGPVGLALAAVASIILLLTSRLHSFHDFLHKVVPLLAGMALVFAGRAGLAAGLKTFLGLLDGMAAAGLAGRFGAIGAAFGGILTKVLSLIRQLPILRGLLATTAEAEAAAGAASVAGAGSATVSMGGRALAGAETAAEGGAVGGALRAGAMGLLKKAGWIGVGISAAQGILEGFKQHSVTAGVEEFFHSITFGLYKTSTQLSEEAASDLNKKLMKLPIGRELNTSDRFGPGMGIFAGRARNRATQDADRLKESADPSRDLKTAFQSLLELRRQLVSFRRDGASKNVFDYYYLSLKQFAAHAPPEFKGVTDQLIANAERTKKKIDSIFARKVTLFELLGDFGAELQKKKPDVDKALAEFVSGVKKLPPQMRGRAQEMAVNIAQGLEDQKKLPADAANKLTQGITNSFDKMRKDTIRHMQRMATRTDAINNALGLALGSKYTWYADEANAALKAMGATKRVQFRLPSAPPSIRFGGDLEDAAAALTGDAAGGRIGRIAGWVKQKGMRGMDSILRLTAPGEAVLNWAHQRVVEPGLAYAKAHGFPFGSLDEVFRRVRGEHGGRAVGGDAAGGFVPMPGTNFSAGDEPKIVRALAALGRIMRTTIYGISGYRTPQHSVAVGGFADDPHTQGRAADIGVGSPLLSSAAALTASLLKRVGLYRPFYPADPHEINHVQLLGSATSQGAITAAATAAVRHLRMLRVDGDGANADIARAALRLVVHAGNRMLDRQSLGGSLNIPGGGLGGDAIANLRIGKKMAAALDWVGAQWTALKQLWTGESGWRKDAKNLSSGAFGIPQALPGSKMASAGRDWLTNASTQIRWGLGYIKQRYGDPVHALAAWLSRSPHWYETGGAVPGSGPVPIVAHGDEHVWTASEVKAAGGHGVMQVLRRMFGGGGQGGPTSYQRGGRVTGHAADGRGFQLPTFYDISQAGIARELGKVNDYLKKLRSKADNFVKSFSSGFDAMAGDEGLFDRFAEAIETMTNRLSTSLTRATFKVTKSGNVIQKLGDMAIADRAADNLAKEYRALVGERGAINTELANITHRLAALRKGGINRDEREAYTTLATAKRDLQTRLDKVMADLASNVQARYQAIEDAIGARVDRATATAGKGAARLDIIQRMRDMFGGTMISQLAGLSGRRGGTNLITGSNQQLGQARADILSKQADSLQKAADLARKKGHGKTADAIAAQIADLRQQALEAVQAGISADVDEINRQASRKSTSADLRGRVAAALGKIDDVGKIATDRISAINDQIAQLKDKQKEASGKGFGALAEQIGDQINELQLTITEITAQALQDFIDQVNNAAARKSSALDIRGRYADLKEKAGNFAGAFADRASILADRGRNLQSQRDALNNLLTVAALQGNQGQVEKLTDQISDLDASIAENTAAIQSNTVQARQAAIDRITSRGGFLTGVFGSLGGLVSALGALTGSTDAATQGGLLQQLINTLRGTGSALRQQLFEGYGIDTRGLSGMDLVTVLRNLNYDGIEANFTEEQRTQFENLINAIIDNATAVETNTQQLNNLTGSLTQSFSSTAWQMFRTAIFNGSGGLLPQYMIPSMDSGGYLLSDGLIYGHRGEQVVAANVKHGGTSTLHEGDTILQVTSPTEVLDPGYVAEVLHFKRSTRRAS